MDISLLNQGVLLVGQPGGSMLEDAINACKQFFNVEELLLHPDFFLISAREGKMSIGVDDVSLLTERGYMRPSIASKQVCVIDGIDTMTIAAQNKILKVCEESRTVIIIAIAYNDTVLDTIKSRLQRIDYKKMTRGEFFSSSDIKEDAELLYVLTNGNIGQVEDVVSYLPNYKKAVDNISNHLLSHLLEAFHLIKEKDEDSVVNQNLVLPTLYLLEYVFTEQLLFISSKINPTLSRGNESYEIKNLLSIIERVVSDRAVCKNQSYTKDNFFLLIAFIVETGGNNYGTL